MSTIRIFYVCLEIMILRIVCLHSLPAFDCSGSRMASNWNDMQMDSPHLIITGFNGYAFEPELIRLCCSTDEDKPRPWARVYVIVGDEQTAHQVRQYGAVPKIGNLLELKGEWTQLVETAAWVVHAANPHHSSRNYGQERLQMEQNVIKLVKRNGKLRRVLFQNSCSFFGATPPETIVDESAPPNPIIREFGYEESVAQIEQECKHLDYFILFLAAFYGNISLMSGLAVASWVHLISKAKPVALASPSTAYALIHAHDCARAFLHLLLLPAVNDSSHSSRYFLVTPPEPAKSIDFVCALAEALGKPVTIEFRQPTTGDTTTVHCWRDDRR